MDRELKLLSPTGDWETITATYLLLGTPQLGVHNGAPGMTRV